MIKQKREEKNCYAIWCYASHNDAAPLRSAMIQCLPQNISKATSLGVTVIISETPSFAEGKHH